MGGTFSTKLKVELYKWSSAEFPQEHALIYTSLEDESNKSTFRLSVNRNKVLCRLADNLCKDHPTRFHIEITAERETNGDYKFGEVKVVSNGTSQDPVLLHDAVCFSYLCDKRLGNYTVRSRDQNIGRVNNLRKTTWEVCHSYDVGFKTDLRYFITIQCNKVTGLCVGFSGPFRFTGLVLEKLQGLQIHREVLGEPPKAFVANVESEFEGELHLLFQQEKRNNGTQGNSVSVQAMGLVNNTGGHTQGNLNGSVFYNCQFYSAP